MSSIDYSFKWPAGPDNVVVTGEFDDWKGTVGLEKSPTTGEFEVTLPISVRADRDKVFFKFIVDGQWSTSGFYNIGTDDAGIENNYVTRHELLGLSDSSSQEPEAPNTDVSTSAAPAAASIPEPTKTRSAAAPQAGAVPVPEAVVARSSKSLNVKPSAPITSQAPVTAASATSAKSASGTSSPTSATPDSAGQSAKKVRVKRKIKKNKKTGERTVVSEVCTPLTAGEEMEGSGNTTYEEEEWSPPVTAASATGAGSNNSPSPSKRHSHYVDASGIGAGATVTDDPRAGTNSEGPGGNTAAEGTVHILPIENESSGRDVFKSLAGEPGPFVPSNQEQLDAFTKINDDVDPQTFNERMNKQFKAEHNVNAVEEKNAVEKQTSLKQGDENMDKQLEGHVDELDKQASAEKSEKTADVRENLEKHGNDDSISATEYEATHDKLSNENAAENLEKNAAVSKSGQDNAILEDTEKRTAQGGSRAGAAGEDSDEKKKSATWGAGSSKDADKNVSPGKAAGVVAMEDADLSTPAKGATKDSSVSDTRLDSEKAATTVISDSSNTKKPSFPKSKELTEKSNSAKESGTAVESPKDNEHATKKKEAKDSNKTNKKGSQNKKGSKKNKSHKKQDSTPTLDPRVRTDATQQGGEEPASQKLSEDMSDGENDLYMDAVTNGAKKSKPSDAGTAGITSGAVAADVPGTADKGLGKEGAENTKIADDEVHNTSIRNENPDSAATEKILKHNAVEPKSKNKNTKDSKSISVAGVDSHGKVSKGHLSEAKGSEHKAVPKDHTANGLGLNSSESEVTGDNKAKEIRKNATKAAKAGKSDLEGGADSKANDLDVLKKNEHKAADSKGKSAKEDVTGTAKTTKSDSEHLRSEVTKDPVSDTVKASTSETGIPKHKSAIDATDVGGTDKSAESGASKTSKSKSSKVKASKSGTGKNASKSGTHKTEASKGEASKSGVSKGSTSKSGSAPKSDSSPKKSAAASSNPKSPSQSAAPATAKKADSADKKKKTGLWSRIKRILQ